MTLFDKVVPRHTPPPLHLDWLQIEVSAVCNASCCYCPTSSCRQQREGGLMEMATFERLRPYLPFCDLVFLQGWGEPLLNPRFWDMARQSKEAGAVTGFTTNGMLLDRERRVMLLDSGVDILAVSLAGVEPGTQARLREGCDLERIGEALTELDRLKRDRGVEKPRVHLAFMLLRSNWREVGALPDLADRWGVSQVVVSDLSWIDVNERAGESLLEHRELWPDVAAAVDEAKTAAANKEIGFHYQGVSATQPSGACAENALKACFVTHRGDVSPCPFASLGFDRRYRAERAPGELIVFGNVLTDTLPEIWNSAAARTFRQSLDRQRSAKLDLPEPCRRCYRLQ